MIRMSASELRKLSSDTQRQLDSLGQVIQQIERVVSSADSQDPIVRSMRTRWPADKDALDQLAADLMEWSARCNQLAVVANEINLPTCDSKQSRRANKVALRRSNHE
ncbi:MAG TPA: hypothetical protein VJ183_13400 [Chloroflexia bacterium]|nr:hypothetical protein [Chloroflexia bacterium]